jgi:hypothetical protein
MGWQFQARLGVLTQILFAALIGGASFAAGGGDPEPDFLPRPLVLVGIYGLVGAIGWVAIERDRPEVLFAASGAALLGSIIAFSGVSLIFVVPASLMGIGAMGMLARGAAPTPPFARVVGGAARAVVLLAALVGAGWTALFVTEAACWTIRDLPGGVEVQPTAYTTGEITIPADAAFTGVGCAERLISARGVGGGIVLGSLALTVAAWPKRRRPHVALDGTDQQG